MKTLLTNRVIQFVIVLAVLVIVVIIVLALLGPAQGNVLRPNIVNTNGKAATPTVLQVNNAVTSNSGWTPVIQAFNGVDMVQVPPGCFMMGSNDGGDDEKPINQQCFDKPFWIDKFEVTQVDFTRLGGKKANPNSFPNSKLPVVHITWFEARDFCKLRGGRLPTEAEWEYAARGPDALVYPWGNTQNKNNLKMLGNQTTNVGSSPGGVSWVGALDMSGNASEWTSSLFKPYPYNATDGREQDTGDNANVQRVVRSGGGYQGQLDISRAAWREGLPPSRIEFDIGGFRCARSADT